MKLFDNFYQKMRKSKEYLQNRNGERVVYMTAEQT